MRAATDRLTSEKVKLVEKLKVRKQKKAPPCFEPLKCSCPLPQELYIPLASMDLSGIPLPFQEQVSAKDLIIARLPTPLRSFTKTFDLKHSFGIGIHTRTLFIHEPCQP
jgi:hypothetical protein